MLIIGIGLLDFLNGEDFLPCRDQPMRAVRKIMFDQPMQTFEPVARDGGKHMMLDVEIHVPIEELHEWVDRKCPAAEPKIRHAVLQADVLGGIAEHMQPTAVTGAERYQYRQQPEMKIERENENKPMSDEQRARPVNRGLSLGRALREKRQFPFPAQPPQGHSKRIPDHPF